MAELSVLIVNYNSWKECAAAIASLREHGPTRPDGTPMPFECVVVDNASPMQPPRQVERVEQELQLLREQQGDDRAAVLIRHDENGGYSKGMNLALAHSRGQRERTRARTGAACVPPALRCHATGNSLDAGHAPLGGTRRALV